MTLVFFPYLFLDDIVNIDVCRIFSCLVETGKGVEIKAGARPCSTAPVFRTKLLLPPPPRLADAPVFVSGTYNDSSSSSSLYSGLTSHSGPVSSSLVYDSICKNTEQDVASTREPTLSQTTMLRTRNGPIVLWDYGIRLADQI